MYNSNAGDSVALQKLGCEIITRHIEEYCAGITPHIDIFPLTIQKLAGMLCKYRKKIIVLPALSENSMQAITNSDPKVVRVRNGNVSSERIRERLTEESICITCL